MKILLTGGSGRVGGAIIRALHGDCFIRDLSLTPPAERVDESWIGSIEDAALVERAVEGVDLVIHNAAIPQNFPDRQLETFRVNLMGTANVLEAMVRQGVRRLIYTSSLCVYGIANSGRLPIPAHFPIDESYPAQPDNAYGLSKLLAERMIEGYRQRFGWDTIAFRLAWARDIAAAATDATARARAMEQLHDPRWAPDYIQHYWDYIDSRDIGQAYALAAKTPGVSGVFNLAASDMWTLENPRTLIERHYPNAEIRNPAIWNGASCWDISAARQALGFEPQIRLRDLLRDECKA